MSDARTTLRSEMKYVVTSAQIPLLKSRITSLMDPDTHAGESGRYHISSVYFDDYRNSCFDENENGENTKEKFRIRIYDHNASYIVLECKKKQFGKTSKQSCPITMEQAQMLLKGKPFPDHSGLLPLLRKMSVQQQMRLLRPVVIVEYDRMAYVMKQGNVRITFDMNISSSADVSTFFSGDGVKRPIMPAGQQLMEVKFDEYLPRTVHGCLNLGELRHLTFSKFHLCRKFTICK